MANENPDTAMRTKGTEQDDPVPQTSEREPDTLSIDGLCFIITKGGKQIEWNELTRPIVPGVFWD